MMHRTTDALPPHLLDRLGGLEYVAKRVVEGFVAGAHRSPYRGSGEEFARHRAYQQGDPLRHIDWRVYARFDRLYVREYRETSSLHCWLVIDASLSMGYAGAAGVTKLRYATYVAAALAHIMLRSGDAVGLAVGADSPALLVPPRNRTGQLHALLLELERVTAAGTAPIAETVDRAAAALRRRGRVVVLSDLLDEADGAAALSKAVARLRSRGSEVALLRVLTPEETGNSPLAAAAYFDPERPASARTGRTDDAGYRARLAAHYARIAGDLRDLGAEYVELQTDEPVELALSRWLLAR
jgi:uncharacterized protein (DUF58 family)